MEIGVEALGSGSLDIARDRGWTPTARIRLSLLSSAIGWAAACFVYLGYAIVSKTDTFLPLALGTAAVVGVGWLLFGMLFAATLSPRHLPLRWPWTPVFGALFSAFAIVAFRSPFPDFRPMAGLGPYVAALIGGIAGTVYGLRVRKPR
jgi:hypothetical protein